MKNKKVNILEIGTFWPVYLKKTKKKTTLRDRRNPWTYCWNLHNQLKEKKTHQKWLKYKTSI
jgi:hypothetical protein